MGPCFFLSDWRNTDDGGLLYPPAAFRLAGRQPHEQKS